MASAPGSEGPRRRDVLRAAGALTLAAGLPQRALARERDPRLVVVILRGGLDGLAAVPPLGDPAFRAARGGPAGERDSELPLDGFFALHPALPSLHARYRAGEALIVHAAATPYRGRAHDEGEAALEGGVAGRPDTGWLNRAASALPTVPGLVAIGASAPLILRGPAPALVCTPAALACAGPAGLARAASAHAGRGPVRVAAPAFGGDALCRMPLAAAGAARLLADPEGARIAVLRCDGFDTHRDQAATLAVRLGALDETLSALADGLAPVWRETIVLVVGEFGRNVGANASGGTDHGVASVAVLIGGAVRGGEILTDWPGLAPPRLDEGALAATTDRAPSSRVCCATASAFPSECSRRRCFPGAARSRRSTT